MSATGPEPFRTDAAPHVQWNRSHSCHTLQMEPVSASRTGQHLVVVMLLANAENFPALHDCNLGGETVCEQWFISSIAQVYQTPHGQNHLSGLVAVAGGIYAVTDADRSGNGVESAQPRVSWLPFKVTYLYFHDVMFLVSAEYRRQLMHSCKCNSIVAKLSKMYTLHGLSGNVLKFVAVIQWSPMLSTWTNGRCVTAAQHWDRFAVNART